MLQITNADIARVEKLLLPAGCTFNDERKAFIRCMESRDVVACPGSGKTTALLAKLLILASRMPFQDNRGVCVLTHTNVAIDEIKKRAGSAADALFRHPNFFGTIQSFVNRFLAISCYRIKYGRSVQSIDNIPFCAEIEKQYNRNYGLKTWIEKRGGSAATLGEYWLKCSDLAVGKDLDSDIPKLRRETKTYKSIESIRQNLLDNGILSYNDAYSLALYYLSTFPKVSKAIQQRFRFVFIDEMQDTDDHQLRVLDKLFTGCDEVVLQRLGDPNQAIYQSKVKQDMLWSPSNPSLLFSDSLRYGATIAKVLDTVRVDCTLTLKPNLNQHSVAPHILLFDSGSEDDVLPAFSDLIHEYGLHRLENPKFSAIGWIGKDNTDEGKVCLRYYHPGYQKSLGNNSKQRWFATLLSYVQAMDVLLKRNPQSAEGLIDLALSGVVHALRLADLKHPDSQRTFTVATLKSFLKQSDEKLHAALLLSFAEWILAFRQGNITIEQFRDLVSAFVRRHFVDPKIEPNKLTEFLSSDSVDFQPPEKDSVNTFDSDAGDKIEIATVHSVKGKTHTAVLYLETFYYTLDSKRILPFCSGKYPKAESKRERHRENLKIAHVAFSRPTHLLAFACCNEHISGYKTELEKAGWVIRDLRLNNNSLSHKA